MEHLVVFGLQALQIALLYSYVSRRVLQMCACRKRLPAGIMRRPPEAGCAATEQFGRERPSVHGRTHDKISAVFGST